MAAAPRGSRPAPRPAFQRRPRRRAQAALLRWPAGGRPAVPPPSRWSGQRPAAHSAPRQGPERPPLRPDGTHGSSRDALAAQHRCCCCCYRRRQPAGPRLPTSPLRLPEASASLPAPQAPDNASRARNVTAARGRRRTADRPGPISGRRAANARLGGRGRRGARGVPAPRCPLGAVPAFSSGARAGSGGARSPPRGRCAGNAARALPPRQHSPSRGHRPRLAGADQRGQNGRLGNPFARRLNSGGRGNRQAPSPPGC